MTDNKIRATNKQPHSLLLKKVQYTVLKYEKNNNYNNTYMTNFFYFNEKLQLIKIQCFIGREENAASVIHTFFLKKYKLYARRENYLLNRARKLSNALDTAINQYPGNVVDPRSILTLENNPNWALIQEMLVLTIKKENILKCML